MLVRIRESVQITHLLPSQGWGRYFDKVSKDTDAAIVSVRVGDGTLKKYCKIQILL